MTQPSTTANGTGSAAMLTLDDKHRDELRASGITDETIAATGIHSVADGEVADILGWRPREYQFGRAMVFPYAGCDGYKRIKLDFPRSNVKGKPVKYESPRGGGNHAYLPPGFDPTASTIVVIEGEKKALAVSQSGTPCIGLSGVWSWQERRMRNDLGKTFGKRKLIDDLTKIDWTNKTVLIVFDSDAIGNTAIQLAECRLSETLTDAGAIVKVVRIPTDGNDKVGADDFIVKRGAAAFQALLGEAKPAELPPKPSSMDYARMFVEEHFTTSAGVGLRWWRDEFYRYARDRYVKVHAGELHAGVFDWLDRLRPDTKPRHASDVVIALGAVCRVPFTYDMPMCIGEGDPVPSSFLRYPNWLSFWNGIIDLDDVLAGKPVEIMRHTPNWFSTLALPYAYDAKAKCDVWFQTLHEIFNGDEELVDLLGEWFGYVLTNDTRQHAILLLEGLP